MENFHYENKLITGTGTLLGFAKEYELVNGSDNQFATASQLFPTGKTIKVNEQDCMVYEYVIYYKVNPNSLKSLNAAGKVVEPIKEPVIMMD